MADPTAVDWLEPGDHVCWTFDDPDRLLTTTTRFVSAGVDLEHKSVVFTQTMLPQALAAGMEAQAVGLGKALASGQVEVTTAEASPLGRGMHDPSVLLDGWADTILAAKREGYKGLRVAVDMAWAAGGSPSATHRLAWYEAQANRVFSDGYAILLCFYDRRLFTAAELTRIASAHPGTARAHAGARGHWGPLLRIRRLADPPGLALAGEADQSNRHALATMLLHLFDDTEDVRGPIHIDLSQLSFADIATARLLVQAARAAKPGLRLLACPPQLAAMLYRLGAHTVPTLGIDEDPRPRWTDR